MSSAQQQTTVLNALNFVDVVIVVCFCCTFGSCVFIEIDVQNQKQCANVRVHVKIPILVHRTRVMCAGNKLLPQLVFNQSGSQFSLCCRHSH